MALLAEPMHVAHKKQELHMVGEKKVIGLPLVHIQSTDTVAPPVLNQDEQIQGYQHIDFRVAWFPFLIVYRCLLPNNQSLFIKTITLIFNHVHSLRSTNINNIFCASVLKREEKKITIFFSV